MKHRVFTHKINLLLSTCIMIGLLTACTGEQPVSVNLSQNLLAGEVQPPLPAGPAAWQFGFDHRLEPKEDVRQIASLANWLQQETGLHFKAHFSPSGSSVVDDLCAGLIDFAAVGTVSYLQAHHLCNAPILVRGLNAQDEDVYQAAIIVPVNSSLQNIADLRGHTFAFGAINSTQGHLIPRLMLQEAGLKPDDLLSYTFTSSHAATANAVTSGRYDAGALQDTLAQDLASRGLVRILAFSNPYPASGIVAGPDVPPKTAEMVQQALLALDPAGVNAEILYHRERTEMPRGFVLARDEDYEELRRIARAIGLLEP
jgi:phosphonate transport system substrate-binding protein